jgi:hypothetical protein
MFRRSTCVLVALGSCALLSNGNWARASYIGGVEHFDGTSKDSFTWEEHYSFPGEGTITQNNAIDLNSPRSGASVDYTTRGATIGVGGSVQVDLSVPSTGDTVALFLGSNSAGTTDTPLGDDHYLELTLNPSTRELIGWVGANGGGSSDGNFAMAPAGATQAVKLRIERMTSDSATFLAYDGAGNLLGSDAVSLAGMPSDLHVALYSYDADATFDNVALAGNFTVTAAAAPEPGIGLLLIGTALAAGTRKRKHK